MQDLRAWYDNPAGARAQATQAATANGDAMQQEEPGAPAGMTPLEEARMLFAQRQAREAARQVCMRTCAPVREGYHAHLLMLWCMYTSWIRFNNMAALLTALWAAIVMQAC